jgi:hypothetical protein
MALSQIGERSLRQMIDRIRGINIGIPPTGTVGATGGVQRAALYNAECNM